MPLLKKFEEKGSNLTPLKGNKPSAPLADGSVIPVNNTFNRGTYEDYVTETPRAVDTTGNVVA